MYALIIGTHLALWPYLDLQACQAAQRAYTIQTGVSTACIPAPLSPTSSRPSPTP